MSPTTIVKAKAIRTHYDRRRHSAAVVSDGAQRAPTRRRQIKTIAWLGVTLLLVGWHLYLHVVLYNNASNDDNTASYLLTQQQSSNHIQSRERMKTHVHDSPSRQSPNDKDDNGDDPPNDYYNSTATASHPTHHACDGYNGIYHILLTDELGGVGTALVQLVLGQLLYAERYNLKPWVHLQANFSKVVYDDAVHGKGPGVHFRMKQASNVTYIHRADGHFRDRVPGPPAWSNNDKENKESSSIRDYAFVGSGIWNHYFEPVSDFVPGDTSCIHKAYVTMDLYLITPGIHGYDTSGLATRAWRYEYLPDYVSQPHLSLHEWLEPQRMRAHEIMQRYIRFRPYLVQAAELANPQCGTDDGIHCLGLHIRHSDKAAGRQVIPLEAFVPYVQAFFEAGGDFVYVATDSSVVMRDIAQSWPASWTNRVRSLGHKVVRSANHTAVFDMASHHQTNQEVLQEILALSRCQFLVHGSSAVSETSIWIQAPQLHVRSVNLEDDRHISARDFGRVVGLTKMGAPVQDLPQPPRTDPWWNELVVKNTDETKTTIDAVLSCDDFDGVLLISDVLVNDNPMIDDIIVSSVLPQLILAEEFNLKPVVRLDARKVRLVYDGKAHTSTYEIHRVIQGKVGPDGCLTLPNKQQGQATELKFLASNIWETYVSSAASHQSDACKDKLVYWFDAASIETMSQRCPPESQGTSSLGASTNQARNDTFRTMRQRAYNLMSKYMILHPLLHRRAAQVNPVSEKESQQQQCLGVHFQMAHGRKHGKLVEQYLPYMKAFVEATKSDIPIYIASDTSRPLRYMEKNLPPEITQRFRSQGPWVTRSSTGDTPLHMMDAHHRINSEMLVDILAMSMCKVLLHTWTATAEAVLFLSPNHTQSINIQDPRRISPSDFKVALVNEITTANEVVHDNDEFRTTNFFGAKILSRKTDSRSSNAIVYLAQKTHSTYGRDSYATLIRSLHLLRKNYLHNETHMNNTDIFIFHVASFNKEDFVSIENTLGPLAKVRLVDLDQSDFWGRPTFLQDSDPSRWYAYPLFAEGYRHMIQFFAIHIWEFFARLNQATGGEDYRYILRLDEDSYIHSPIDYDIFQFMETHGYRYGYRMCSYEMQTAHRMWKRYQQSRGRHHVPKRQLELNGCGFYNNFFVADLSFFRRAEVQDFLQFVYSRGHIYTWRLGDLMIHTMTVFKFAHAIEIHRFLDFTYEHGTRDNNSTAKCLVWGGMQAGYRDTRAVERLSNYYHEQSQDGFCPLNQTTLQLNDLSPTYAHLSPDIEESALALHTVVAGSVEVVGKGLLSG